MGRYCGKIPWEKIPGENTMEKYIGKISWENNVGKYRGKIVSSWEIVRETYIILLSIFQFTINTGSVNASVKLKWQGERHEIQDNYHKTGM